MKLNGQKQSQNIKFTEEAKIGSHRKNHKRKLNKLLYKLYNIS